MLQAGTYQLGSFHRPMAFHSTISNGRLNREYGPSWVDMVSQLGWSKTKLMIAMAATNDVSTAMCSGQMRPKRRTTKPRVERRSRTLLRYTSAITKPLRTKKNSRETQ